MRLYSHYCTDTLSNSYLIGPEGGGDATLVDPATFDVTLLETVEGLGYYVRNILLTHLDERHLGGLRTIERIYDCTVYAAHAEAPATAIVRVTDGETLETCCGPLRVIMLPGMSSDSVAYEIGGFVFTGLAMSAAEHGPVQTPYARALLLANIRDRILSLSEESVILPFVGPPSTIGLERLTFVMSDPTLPEALP